MSLTVLGQRPSGTGGGAGTGTGFDSLGVGGLGLPDGPDSTILRYFYLDDITSEYSFQDTTMEYFEDFDPTKDFDQFYLTLGNQASSHISALYKGEEDIFAKLRVDQYPAFNKSIERHRFYTLNRPFNDLYFSPMGSQSNFLTKAKFSRDFKEEVNVSLDYLRFTNDGEYQNQASRATNFIFGFWIKSPKKAYQTFVNFNSNNHLEKFNGGHTDAANFSLIPGNRLTIPVTLSEAELKKQDYQITIENYIGDPEKWNVYHKIGYRFGSYRFADELENLESNAAEAYYGNLIVDSRGIRNYQAFDILSNRIIVGRGENHPVFINAGLTHQYQRYDLETTNIVRNDLSLDGKLGLSIANLFIKGAASLGLGNAAGNLKLDASLGFNSDKLFKLTGGFKLIRNESYIQDRLLILSHQQYYENEFQKIFTTNLYGKLEIPFTKTAITASSLLINNAMYYNGEGLPLQAEESVTGIQLSLSQKLGWKWIQSDHRVHYQAFNTNLWNLPSLLSKHKLYVQFHLFDKALELKAGATFSQYLQDNSISFNPVTGNFYPIDGSNPWYKNVDAFVVGKIKTFRMFLVAENALNLIDPNILYQVEKSPQWDFQLRFGVRWILFD